MNKLFPLILALFLLNSISATAAVFSNIPCKDLPPQAMRVAPPPLNAVANVVCTPYGQMLRPARDNTWTVSSGTPMIIPAQENTQNPTPGESAIYFTKFDVKELSAAEKAPYLASFLEKDPNLAVKISAGLSGNSLNQQKTGEALQAVKVYQLTAATSYLGFARNMYFFESPNNGIAAGLVYIAGDWRFFGIAKNSAATTAGKKMK